MCFRILLPKVINSKVIPWVGHVVKKQSNPQYFFSVSFLTFFIFTFSYNISHWQAKGVKTREIYLYFLDFDQYIFLQENTFFLSCCRMEIISSEMLNITLTLEYTDPGDRWEITFYLKLYNWFVFCFLFFYFFSSMLISISIHNVGNKLIKVVLQ